VSLRHNRNAGQEYLKQRVMDRAHAANSQINELSWYEPAHQDMSKLTVTSRSKTQTHVLHNLDLEDDRRRHYLDELAEFIVQDFA
jgi:hypothetical protein